MRLRRNPGRQFGGRHSGFTLLEVLIAVVVLAVGLLGLASLQAVSLQFNQSAYFRTQATNLAYEMADRMRSDRQGDFDGTTLENPPPACNRNLALNQDSVAARDIAAWRNALACTLPGGTGSISIADEVVTITVQWNDNRDDANSFAFVLETRR